MNIVKARTSDMTTYAVGALLFVGVAMIISATATGLIQFALVVAALVIAAAATNSLPMLLVKPSENFKRYTRIVFALAVFVVGITLIYTGA